MMIMIQRIQTVYLFLAAVAMIVGAIHSFSMVAVGVVALVAACVSLYAISLYKKRPLQLTVSRILALFGVAFICFHCRGSSGDFSQKSFIWPVAATAVACILWVLAARAIMRDEKLVRSLDRIR